MRRRNRNVLLLCDNAPCHDHAELQLSNTRVAFLPPNITTLLRPLNQGIIQFAKAHYRTQLIRQLVITVDNNGTVDHFANKAEILTAILMIKRAFLVGAFSFKEKSPTITVASFFLFFVRPQSSSRMYHFLHKLIRLLRPSQANGNLVQRVPFHFLPFFT